MGRRTMVELLHIAAGLMAAAAIAAVAAWAYPMGRTVVWWCGAAAQLTTILMGIGPLRRARIADRAADRVARA